MKTYGEVRSVTLAHGKTQTTNCVAFVEFKDKRGFDAAYRGADKQVRQAYINNLLGFPL
jgi:hypothetical protein